jgi:beta-lactamase class A
MRRIHWMIAFCLIFFVGGYLTRSRFASSAQTQQVQTETTPETDVVRQSGYRFINPLLDCEDAEGRINKFILPFKEEIARVVEEEKNTGTAGSISVYFRDLNNGPWFGINERRSYPLASLLKLPLALNLYKMSETRPNMLNLNIPFSAPYQLPLVQRYPPEKEIEPGRGYSIEELIEAALLFSDNQSTELLLEQAPKKLDEAGYLADTPVSLKTDLVYLESIFGEQTNTLSAREYATFFRILYNASFLHRNLSEHVLELLSQSTFRVGIVAGVPSDVPVAHKFGESGTAEESQLHDCGIVYHAVKPYILCIMTSGKDPNTLPGVIQHISAAVYANIDAQTKK